MYLCVEKQSRHTPTHNKKQTEPQTQPTKQAIMWQSKNRHTHKKRKTEELIC
jgi:hypothetical protein